MLALGLVGGAALLVRLALLGPHEPPAQVVAPARPQAPIARDGSATLAQAREAERNDVVPPATAPAAGASDLVPSAASGLSPLEQIARRTPIPDSYFDSLYAGLTAAELHAATAEKAQAYGARAGAIVAEMDAQGTYELRPREAGKVGIGLGEYALAGLIASSKSIPHDPNIRLYLVPCLDYPDVYDLRDEYTWLTKKTGGYEQPFTAVK